jgi:hypothetical protein
MFEFFKQGRVLCKVYFNDHHVDTILASPLKEQQNDPESSAKAPWNQRCVTIRLPNNSTEVRLNI